MTNSEYKNFLDNLFNVFTIIGRGNYVAACDVKANVTRFSPAAVELFGLPEEYISDGCNEWKNYIHPEDKLLYTRTMNALLEGKTQGRLLCCRSLRRRNRFRRGQ